MGLPSPPVRATGYCIAWSTPAGELTALSPTPAEVLQHAPKLAIAYSHPRNAPLLGQTGPATIPDVVEHYELLAAEGAQAFVLLRDGELVGDADLRGIAEGAAEFAFLIADPSAQGRGLGTRFAIMVHGFAFRTLGLAMVYAAIVPANQASRRVFEKLGYRIDASPAARQRADAADDVTLSLARPDFERAFAAELAAITIRPR